MKGKNSYTTQQFLISQERNNTVTTGKALDGNPYAGNSHVAPSQCYGGTDQFYNVKVALTAMSRRGSLMCNRIAKSVVAVVFGMRAFAAFAATVITGQQTFTENESLTGPTYIGHDGTSADVTIADGAYVINSGDLNFSGNETGRFETHASLSIAGRLQVGILYLTPYSFNDGVYKGHEFGRITLHEGGVLDASYVIKNDDPSVTVDFNGGVLHIYNVFYAGATIPLNLHYVSGWGLCYRGVNHHPIRLNLTNGGGNDEPYLAWREAGRNLDPLYLTGDGGLVVSGSGKVQFGPDDAVYADYTGDTVFSHDYVMNAGAKVPVGAGKGIVRVAAGVFDLNGMDFSANNIVGEGGVVQNSSATMSRVTVGLSGDDFTMSAALPENAHLVKKGDGCMSLACPVASIEVGDGSLVPLSNIAEFPHYRFAVESCKGKFAEAMQIGEFKLMLRGTDVTQGYVSASCCPEGTQPYSSEGPTAALDGDLATKFCDPHLAYWSGDKRCWLQVDYAQPKKIDAYTWSTGDDCYEVDSNRNRSPKDFVLQGSMDGVEWVDIDTRTGFEQPDVGATNWIGIVFNWIGSPSLTGGTTVLDNSRVKVCDGAELLVPEGKAVSVADIEIADGGSASLSCGSTLAIGGGSLVGCVKGNGILQVASGNATFGTVASAKWIRLSITRWDDSVNKVFQLSEFGIYDDNGRRINANLEQKAVGTEASALAPGSFCVRDGYVMTWCGSGEQPSCLFDGDTATKFCTTIFDMSPIVLTMRLPDNVGTPVKYNFCTANDCPERSPVDWTLEASYDGNDWFVVDSRTKVTRPTNLYTWYNGSSAGYDNAFVNAGETVVSMANLPIGRDIALEVDRGASLDATIITNGTVSALVYDFEKGGGSITGIDLSESGALYVVNVPRGTDLALSPLAFDRLSVKNGQNLSRWSVYVNERLCGLSAGVVNNTIAFQKHGMAVIVR